jgi:hypothetical protein
MTEQPTPDPIGRICARVAELEHEMLSPTPRRVAAARILGMDRDFFYRRELSALYWSLRIASGLD